ncbi:hypothetical protein [Thermococcus gorgonarius]|uniref:Uncharacterized protein n=1 Tax=Thermococcus gorgonarius TaxID=71997 RepID=A0A2Z2M7T4_THEGO|nr:hypothetical protein [Thermococcus gorgonarius]ASJ00412.1 hypothetical protein A3K92_02385 [Thermococcus gorgonarius]
MLLTRHAKERLIKRLAKRRKPERVYSRLWEFLDRSIRMDVNGRIVIFTDGRKSLVCAKLDCERLSLEEIKNRVEGIKHPYECVFFDGRLARKTVPGKFLDLVPKGVYCFYLNREKRALYIGSEPPLLAITFRPAKKGERDLAKSLSSRRKEESEKTSRRKG